MYGTVTEHGDQGEHGEHGEHREQGEYGEHGEHGCRYSFAEYTVKGKYRSPRVCIRLEGHIFPSPIKHFSSGWNPYTQLL